MGSKYNDVANIVKNWDSRWGSEGNCTEEIIEILKICHEMVNRAYEAVDLADAIADYLIAAFVPQTLDFDEDENEGDQHGVHNAMPSLPPINITPEILAKMNRKTPDGDSADLKLDLGDEAS